mmetsp:Transcript_15094/g.42818  ORF Transcript_15094/g.42818 Transcript_15094/m.42818 type:complete len:221 (-) Transcript_15094:135-797(-)
MGGEHDPRRVRARPLRRPGPGAHRCQAPCRRGAPLRAEPHLHRKRQGQLHLRLRHGHYEAGNQAHHQQAVQAQAPRRPGDRQGPPVRGRPEDPEPVRLECGQRRLQGGGAARLAPPPRASRRAPVQRSRLLEPPVSARSGRGQAAPVLSHSRTCSTSSACASLHCSAARQATVAATCLAVAVAATCLAVRPAINFASPFAVAGSHDASFTHTCRLYFAHG